MDTYFPTTMMAYLAVFRARFAGVNDVLYWIVFHLRPKSRPVLM